MVKWHTSAQLTLKQMRAVVLELALCQAKLQLQIQHPAWLSDRKPAPDLTALLRFSTTGGFSKLLNVYMRTGCVTSFSSTRGVKRPAHSQEMGPWVSWDFLSIWLIDPLPQIEHSSCWGWLLLPGASSQVPLVCSVLCSEAQLNERSALECWCGWTCLVIHPLSLAWVLCPHTLGKPLLVCKMCNSDVASALQVGAWDSSVLGLWEWFLPISWMNNAVPSLVILLSMIQNGTAKILSMLCNGLPSREIQLQIWYSCSGAFRDYQCNVGC